MVMSLPCAQLYCFGDDKFCVVGDADLGGVSCSACDGEGIVYCLVTTIVLLGMEAERSW
jgi:hypothetical protein